MANEIKKGSLYIVATPIGNLSDLSPRAVKVLSEVDFIAAEDTRNTVKLLTHLGIKKPMISYYEHNKHEHGEIIVRKIKDEGQSCALVSDAGTPAISDPGEDLVKLCALQNIEVFSVPGPCAAICALTLSGLFTGRFVFEGFLSTAKNSRLERLEEVKNEERTLIFYEAPHHLVKTLEVMLEILGDRRISLAREITKINEEVRRTTISEALAYYSDNQPKGEFVLVIEGAEHKEEAHFWEEMSIRQHFDYYSAKGMERMDAIKKVASDRGVGKSAVYKQLLD
ncbi:MAG: 16S rRNA (cytidine(1402)-2'-O)-methyltransferase [Ruminococcaceae bacterium]|nr:16S rRNA (cytidine(1402)-2'-O)-methyltransferase [Oscillospiraceae bacterium]